MNQNEYDELKEQIYRLKQYVDMQDLKMSKYVWHQCRAVLGWYYDPAIDKKCFLSSKEDVDKYTDSALEKVCHEINSKMIEMGIVHEKSRNLIFPVLDQFEYDRIMTKGKK